MEKGPRYGWGRGRVDNGCDQGSEGSKWNISDERSILIVIGQGSEGSRCDRSNKSRGPIWGSRQGYRWMGQLR